MKTKYKHFRFDGRLAHHIRFPDDYKHKLACSHCGVVFGAKRWDASTCSSQCRQGEYRKRKGERVGIN